MYRRSLTILFCQFLLLGAGCTGFTGLVGLPSAQDGTWIGTPTTATVGINNYTFQISQDRLVRVNVSGIEWTVQQTYPANRLGSLITWKTIAAPPAGLPFASTSEFDLEVTPQVDGTMSGNFIQGIATIPGIASIPTSTTAISVRRI